MPHFLATADADFETRFTALLGMKREDSPDVDAAVAAIIADVRTRGDAAVIELTEKFDRLSLTQLRRIGSLASLKDKRVDNLTLTQFTHKVRALRDPEILTVTISSS